MHSNNVLFQRATKSGTRQITSSNVNPKVRRQIRATVLALAAKVGGYDPTTGIAVCVGCGRKVMEQDIHMGHVDSDKNGGHYWPHNLLPLCGNPCNRRMGAAHMMDTLTPRYDARADWDGELVADPGARPDGEWLPPTR